MVEVNGFSAIKGACIYKAFIHTLTLKPFGMSVVCIINQKIIKYMCIFSDTLVITVRPAQVNCCLPNVFPIKNTFLFYSKKTHCFQFSENMNEAQSQWRMKRERG